MQAKVITEFLLDGNVEGQPSIHQLRRKCWDTPLDDFILNLGIEVLRFVQSPRYERSRGLLIYSSMNLSNTMSSDIANDLLLTRELSEFKEKHKWPLIMNCLKMFANNATLSKLRKHRSQTYHHTMIPIPEKISNNKTCRTKCTLCSKSHGKHRQTSFMCSTCFIPLCGCPYGKHTTTCFELWHVTDALLSENHRCNENIVTAKVNSGRKRSAD